MVVAGTTGESPTVLFSEHQELLVQAVRLSPIPVIAGAGGNSTAEAVHLTKWAERAGAEAVLSVVPYYNKPPQDGLFHHYGMVCKATCLPVILYNVPGRTVVALEPRTALRIRDSHKNCVGIKEASANLEAVRQYVDRGFNVWCGEDAMNYPMLCLGANGVISVVSNFAPVVINRLLNCFTTTGIKLEARTFDRIVSMCAKAAFIEVNPIPVKFILAEMGLGHNLLRLPLVPLDQVKQEQVRGILRTAAILPNKIR